MTTPVDILIVEDDPDIAALMAMQLSHRKGFHCEIIDHGDKAKTRLLESHCRLLILDRMLPGFSGMQLLRWLRKEKTIAHTPVLMVTALGTAQERVHGLSDGADDYLPKPFDPDELLARVEALLRRAEQQNRPASALEAINRADDPTVAEDGLSVLVGSIELTLRPMELAVLKVLMKKPGKVRSRDYLLDKVWGLNNFVEPRTVDVTVKRLRESLGKHGLKKCIKTVRGMGYCYRKRSKEKSDN
ncbi:MAG: response regulator transcription factor [Mariprofundales bacterium]